MLWQMMQGLCLLIGAGGAEQLKKACMAYIEEPNPAEPSSAQQPTSQMKLKPGEFAPAPAQAAPRRLSFSGKAPTHHLLPRLLPQSSTGEDAVSASSKTFSLMFRARSGCSYMDNFSSIMVTEHIHCIQAEALDSHCDI